MYSLTEDTRAESPSISTGFTVAYPVSCLGHLSCLYPHHRIKGLFIYPSYLLFVALAVCQHPYHCKQAADNVHQHQAAGGLLSTSQSYLKHSGDPLSPALVFPLGLVLKRSSYTFRLLCKPFDCRAYLCNPGIVNNGLFILISETCVC